MMDQILKGLLAGILIIAPATAFAQHTAPGAPLVQGDQQNPSTSIAPQGSAPARDAVPGELVSRAVSELQGAEVVNELGEPVGVVEQFVEGEGSRIYVVVALGDDRSTIFPIMLMGVSEEKLVVRGYGGDLLRAQRLEPNALLGFSPVHSARSVEIPQVAIAGQ